MLPKSKSWRGALLVGLALMFAWVVSAYGPNSEWRARRELDAKYDKAKALFEERCKTAGVMIKRTVKDVEGIELLKVRPKDIGNGYFDPMFEGAAMADEAQGEHYLKTFLWVEYRNRYRPEHRGQLNSAAGQPADNELPGAIGYRYVEARDPADGQRYRFELPLGFRKREGGSDPGLVRRSPGPQPLRYAVDYEDIVDPGDRAYWIAGTRINVIDQSNGEVIAQLTRYVWDRGFGANSTGRLPWQHASSQGSNECPRNDGFRSYVTRYFVDSVLIPKQGD